MTRQHRLVLCIAVMLATCAVSAGFAGSHMPVKFHRLMLADGLSQSSVIALHQDSRGFIWMGTQDGLNRYDGRNIISYKADPDDPYSLSDPNIWGIVEDVAGDLWIGTEGGGFNRYNRQLDNFTPYRHDPKFRNPLSHYNVKTVAIDHDGFIWLGTIGDGILRFDPATERIESYGHDPDDPTSLPSDEVQSLLIDEHGAVWAGTTVGLTRLSPATGGMSHYYHDPQDAQSLSAGEVRCLTAGTGGRLWVGTSKGLSHFDPATATFERYLVDDANQAVPKDLSISALLEDPDGQVWVGSERRGLYVLDPETGQCRAFLHDTRDPFSLSDNEVYSIIRDRTGVFWIGTSNGANRLDSKAKQFYHVTNQAGDKASLSNACVWSIWEDRQGQVWAVTESGLNVMDPATGRVKQVFADPKDPLAPSYDSFIEIFEDDRGFIWLGARDGALNRYDPDSGVYRRFPTAPGSSDGPDDDRVFSITGDRRGRVWVGTMTGLECYDPETDTFTSYVHDPRNRASLPDGSVRDLMVDNEGRLWLSVWSNGAACFDPETETFRHFKHKPNDRSSLSSNVVLSIFQDSRNRMWLGTSSGLNLLNPATGRCLWYSEHDGLPNNTIYRVQEDRAGSLWVSTNYGLARFDPDTGLVNTYLVRDGIQDNEFNMGASHLGRSGKMYFGGINGFTSFYPDSIRHNPFVPAVVLTDFRIFNKPVPPGKRPDGRVILEKPISETEHIELSHRDHVISFEFSVLHFASPEKNNFAYMLEGFESQWNEVGTRNHATYTNLPPGEYVFRVRGANNDGIWNEEGAAVNISVKPPFYRKAWFLTAVLVFIWGVIYGGHRYRIRLMDVKNKELEGKVNERTEDLTHANSSLQKEVAFRKRIEDELREAKNVAEAATLAKSEFLANMSHEIRTPMNGVLGMTSIILETELSQEQREFSEMIYSSANNLLVIINDILDFSKIEAGKLKLERIEFDICDVVDRVTEMLAFKAHKKGLHFSCRISPDVPRILRGDPGRLTQILINLANNAVKFTAAGKVEVQVSLVKKRKSWAELRFEVNDTGVGIPAGRVGRIFGSFTQVDASITRQYGGTGLGLAIAKQLTTLMGGEIGVDSVEGQGAHFWFTVGFSAESERDVPEYSGRILLVHDNIDMRLVMVDQLAYLGYRSQAVSPDEAVATLSNAVALGDPFAVVLAGGGDQPAATFALVRELRTVCGKFEPEFILLSKLGCVADQDALRANGLVTYLSVPVHHSRLEIALGDITGNPPDETAAALRKSQGPDSPALSATEAQLTIDGERPLLLLAEDNPINQKVACLMLNKIGYDVDIVANGYEVLDAVENKDYAAILMDVQMPEMDGLEAARRIRADGSPARDPQIPIIALTAHAMDQDRMRSLAAGMDDHASKPIDSETIAKLLAWHIPATRQNDMTEAGNPAARIIPHVRV